MLAISLSIAACLGWGIADFMGGCKSRSLPAITVLMFSNLVGIGVGVMLLGGLGRELPAEAAFFYWVVLGGVVAIIGMVCLYRGLAAGPMSVVAPISATAAVIPVAFGALMGEDLTIRQLMGMTLAVAGAALSASERRHGSRSGFLSAGIAYAFGATVMFGFYFLIIGRASRVDPYWAAFLMRLTFASFLIPVFLATRTAIRVGRGHLPGLLVMGAADAMAGFSFTVAASIGMLSIVSVVSSLAPAVTAVLSMLLLREVPRGVQWIGVVLAIIGVAVISAG